MSKVYIPQEPVKFQNGEPVPIFDLTPASKYGELRFLLPHGQVMLNTMPMINKLRQKLSDFCDNDYILAVGDPTAIAATAAIASMNNRGRIQILKWSRQLNEYVVVKIDISGRNYDENKL